MRRNLARDAALGGWCLRNFGSKVFDHDPSARNINVTPDVLDRTSESIDRRRGGRGRGRGRGGTSMTPFQQQRKAHLQHLRNLEEEISWRGASITSVHNELATHLQKLRKDPAYRKSSMRVSISGRHIIEELGRLHGVHPHTMLVSSKTQAPEWVHSSTEVVRAAEHIVQECDASSDGFIGDFEIPEPPAKEALFGSSTSRMNQVLVLDNITDPGNLGTLLRSAAAFCYDAVLLVNHCADLYDHRVVRAARGAHFQKVTPFFVVREEDGDNTFELINQTIEKHRLQPFLYTPKLSVPRSSIGEAAPDTMQPSSVTTSSNSTAHVKSIHQVWTERFQNDTLGNCGNMLIMGPDYKGGLLEKSQVRLRTKPQPVVVDLLDAPASTGDMSAELMLHAPTLLYHFRHTAAWDYMLPGTNASELASTQTTSTAAGMFQEPDLHEGEMRQAANYRHKNRVSQREAKQLRSDEDVWMETEMGRIMNMSQRESDALNKPWERHDPTRKVRKDPVFPEKYPHPIEDRRVALSRDDLRKEQEIMSNYTRSDAYTKYRGQ